LERLPISGFKNNENTAGTWKKLSAQADQSSHEIMDELLSRQRSLKHPKLLLLGVAAHGPSKKQRVL